MRYLLFSLSVLLFVACNNEKVSTFTLEGQIENPERNFLLLQQESNIEKKETTFIDTIFLDAAGKFKVSFNEEPHFYRLIVNENLSVPLVLDQGQSVKVNIDATGTEVTGSKDTDLLLEYETFRAASLERLVRTIRREITAESKNENPDPLKIDSLGKLEISNYDQHLEELNTFIKDKMGTSLALYPTSIRWKGEENIEFYNELVTAFETKHPHLSISHVLREKVTRLQQTSIGGTVSDIALKTPKGDEVKLSDVSKKLTLVEFWASWCGPCRREGPVLKRLYNKYNNQGFEIYSISLDTNEKHWLGALEKDSRTWTNVSSLEGFTTPAAYAYSVTALPMNYLIDEEGVIIAKGIHGDDLEQLVEELMIGV